VQILDNDAHPLDPELRSRHFRIIRGVEFEKRRILRRPITPENNLHNAHMYYLLLPDLRTRNMLIERLKRSGIHAVFHYVPIHLTRYPRSDLLRLELEELFQNEANELLE